MRPWPTARAAAASLLLASVWNAAVAQDKSPASAPARPALPAIDGGRGYVVFPETMDVRSHEDAADCLNRALTNTVPSARAVDRETFRDALYPWLEPTTKPRNQEQMLAWMARPVVQARLRQLNVRYLAVVAARVSDTARYPIEVCGPVRCLGRGALTVRTDMTITVWDILDRRMVGETVAGAEKDGYDGWIGPVPVTVSPDTIGAACADASLAMVRAMLAGTPRR